MLVDLGVARVRCLLGCSLAPCSLALCSLALCSLALCSLALCSSVAPLASRPVASLRNCQSDLLAEDYRLTLAHGRDRWCFT